MAIDTTRSVRSLLTLSKSLLLFFYLFGFCVVQLCRVSPLLALLFADGLRGDENLELLVGAHSAGASEGSWSGAAGEGGSVKTSPIVPLVAVDVSFETSFEDASLLLALRRSIREAVVAVMMGSECVLGWEISGLNFKPFIHR